MGDGITVTPIGVGAAYGRPGQAQSAYLVRCGSTGVCLDLGAGTFNRLLAHAAPQDLDAIVVSHAHADHCADLLSLRIYMVYGPGRGHDLDLYGPPGLRERLAPLAGGDEWGGCRFVTIDPGRPLVIGALTLTFAEVPHLPPTYAVRIDAAGGSLTYGADCGPNGALEVLASECDVLIAESSLGVEPAPRGAIHLGGSDAGAIARRAGVASLLLTHCYPEHDPTDTLRAARETFEGPVEWAEEGREVAISAR